MAKKTPTDPTGLRDRRGKAAKRLQRRLGNAQKAILPLIRRLEVTRTTEKPITNSLVAIYEYALTPEQRTALQAEVRAIIFGELLGTYAGNLMPSVWWWKKEIEPAYRVAVAETVIDLNRLIDQAARAGVTAQGLPIAKIPLDLVLTSPRYLKRLSEVYIGNFQKIKTLSEYTANQVLRVIDNGINSGLSRADISADIMTRFDVSKSNAERIAKTEINGAYNDAKLNAIMDVGKQTGLEPAVVHISALSKTTRDTHAARHNKLYTPMQQKRWWDKDANRINCFVPGTTVQGRFSAGLKSRYTGEVVELVTRDGRRLTVTPNHKIMTDNGLIPAAKIDKGFNLITYGAQIENTVRVGNLDVYKIHPTIEQVFASLLKVGHTSPVGIMGVNFNGDERFVDKYVDRVNVDRVLVFGGDASAFQCLDYLALKHADAPPIGLRPFFERFNRIFSAAPSFTGFFSELFALLRRAIFSPVNGPIASIAPSDTPVFKDSVNHVSAKTDPFSYRLDGLPFSVGVDNVVDVRFTEFDGHVYDLEEKSGLIIANGIIASNCKCTVSTVLRDDRGKIVDQELIRQIQSDETKNLDDSD